MHTVLAIMITTFSLFIQPTFLKLIQVRPLSVFPKGKCSGIVAVDFFTCSVLFLSSNQWHQSTEGICDATVICFKTSCCGDSLFTITSRCCAPLVWVTRIWRAVQASWVWLFCCWLNSVRPPCQVAAYCYSLYISTAAKCKRTQRSVLKF